ncbi:hypothetical protein IGK47_003837 [Enterococcus sp. AZ007]
MFWKGWDELKDRTWFVKNFQNEISDSIMVIENIQLALPIKYTRGGLEEMLHD